MMQRLAGLGLVALALLLVLLGLWQVGGPETARRELRDDQRLQDLIDFARHLSCTSAQADAAEQFCGAAPRDRDRYTQQPFQVRGDQVCAVFETALTPEQVEHRFGVRFDAGCVAVAPD